MLASRLHGSYTCKRGSKTKCQALNADLFGRNTSFTSLTMPKICNSGYGMKITRTGSSLLPNASKPYRRRGTRQKYHALKAMTPIRQVLPSSIERTL